jgi:hypothetical protein
MEELRQVRSIPSKDIDHSTSTMAFHPEISSIDVDAATL